MQRRLFLLALLGLPGISLGQSANNERLAVLNDLIKAIGSAGQILSSLAASIKKTGAAKDGGYGIAAAERERQRLSNIALRTTRLIRTQNLRVVRSLDDYLALPRPSNGDWDTVIENLKGTLSTVQALLVDVERENKSFINPHESHSLKTLLAGRSEKMDQAIEGSADQKPGEPDKPTLSLQETLEARTALLAKLTQMRPPFSAEERDLLGKASREYKILISNAEAALKEINAYLAEKN